MIIAALFKTVKKYTSIAEWIDKIYPIQWIVR